MENLLEEENNIMDLIQVIAADVRMLTLSLETVRCFYACVLQRTEEQSICLEMNTMSLPLEIMQGDSCQSMT